MKPKIKIALIIILYLGIIFINTNVYATTGITTSDTTRIRSEASTDSNTIILISIYTEVEIIGEEGDWYKVSYSGYTGYIRKDMLTVSGETGESSNTVANTTSESSNTTAESSNTAKEETNTTTSEEQITAETVEENSVAVNTETENTTEENDIISDATNLTAEANSIEEGNTGTLITSVDVKILPSINSSIIATIPENTAFTVVEVINKWCYIETENNYGWVLTSKITSNNETDSPTETTVTEIEETETEVAETVEEETQEVEETTETNTTTSTATETTITSTTTKYVATDTLNVRKEANNTSSIIVQLKLNTQVTVVEVVDSTWSKITYNGTTGYVASQYLSDTTTLASSRSETSTRASSTSGTSTEETTETTDSESTETSTQTSTSTSSSSSESSSGVTGTDIVAYAKQYLGYKYVSGGSSPSTGFDCSGFTYYVYKHFGITLSRTSSAQASNGTAVSKSNLQAGDLVIFNNSSNSSIGHVGIYIGSNSFIHAANSSKGVITTSLSDSYYSARYVTARRIIN